MNHCEKLSALLLAAVLLCGLPGCGEEISSVDSNAVIALPVTDVTTAETTVTETTTVTTTTASPWPDNLAEKENNGVLIENVPHYTQFNNYRTACESIATVSVLQYYGINMSIDRFLEDYLPTAPYPTRDENGELHGESPYEYFLGDPHDADAYGCFSGAIVKGVDKYRKGLAVAERRKPLSWLCSHYIDKGEPVVIWATMFMLPTQESMRWTTPDDETIIFLAPEHALVLIGYDDYRYYFCDSLQYPEVCSYPKESVEKAYEAMGKQAVVIDTSLLDTIPERWRIHKEEEEETNADSKN